MLEALSGLEPSATKVITLAPPPYHDLVDNALSGRLCVTAWLGYGQVLFIGFGDEPYEGGGADVRHPRPPVEIETNFAEWRIDGPGPIAVSDDELPTAESAAFDLIGRRVVNWGFIEPSIGLVVSFSGGKNLTIIPWADDDSRNTDAWSITLPDDRVLAFSTCGKIAFASLDQPIPEWFWEGGS